MKIINLRDIFEKITKFELVRKNLNTLISY